MIGAIVGDVIGSCFERCPTKFTDFDLYSEDSVFTDDTVLTVAVADWILNGGELCSYFRKLVTAERSHNEPPGTIVCVAVYAIASLVACLLITALGCGPTAPSVANGPPTVSWRHLRTESWRYELDDPKRIANYSFGTNGGVLWSEGTIQGDLCTVTALGGYWYIDTAGDLIFTDENHSQAYRTWKLVALTPTTATVFDCDSGITETYFRRFTP